MNVGKTNIRNNEIRNNAPVPEGWRRQKTKMNWPHCLESIVQVSPCTLRHRGGKDDWKSVILPLISLPMLYVTHHFCTLYILDSHYVPHNLSFSSGSACFNCVVVTKHKIWTQTNLFFPSKNMYYPARRSHNASYHGRRNYKDTKH